MNNRNNTTPASDSGTPPTPWDNARLESALRAIASDPAGSAPSTDTESPHEAALRAERRAARRPAPNPWFIGKGWAIAACVMLLVSAFASVAILPSLSASRSVALESQAPPSDSVGPSRSAPAEDASASGPAILGGELAEMDQSDAARGSADRARSSLSRPAPSRLARPLDTGEQGIEAATPSFNTPPAPRLVIRDGSMRIKVNEVDAAVNSLRAMVRAERGEFIESMRRTSDHEAILILKVESTRFMATVDEASSLGEVIDERMNGRDVTEQAIDLDARIRNAQRVEAELLALLEAREDQPLRDVLELQRELGEARQQVERLVSQGEGLIRMATLATLRITVFTDPPESDPAPQEPDESFFMGIAEAWRDGLLAMRGTIEFLVRVLVGGAIFWLLLAIASATLWSVHRRSTGYAV